MPTVAVNITNLTSKDSNNERKNCTYAKVSGPDWATVSSDGDINLSNPGDQSAPGISISWTLPNGANLTFKSSDAFTTDPVSDDFDVTDGEGTVTLTVSDTNNDTPQPNGVPYAYTLYLSDGSRIDPRVINY